MNKNSFITKYPIQLNTLIAATVIFHGTSDVLKGLKHPTMKHIRIIAESAGYSYGAIRTSLSRMIKNEEIIQFSDSNGIKRFKQNPLQIDIGNSVMNRYNSNGFLLAIYNFKKNESKKRDSVRYLLKNYGFKKIAQNTYITGNINTSIIKKEIEKLESSDNVMFFKVNETDSEDLKNKLTKIFSLEERKIKLTELYEDLKKYLIPCDDILERLVYAGPVYFNNCFIDEPLLPLEYLPNEYPLQKIINFMNSFTEEINSRARKRYIEIEKRG